jgi:hypothetical protein
VEGLSARADGFAKNEMMMAVFGVTVTEIGYDMPLPCG